MSTWRMFSRRRDLADCQATVELLTAERDELLQRVEESRVEYRKLTLIADELKAHASAKSEAYLAVVSEVLEDLHRENRSQKRRIKDAIHTLQQLVAP